MCTHIMHNSIQQLKCALLSLTTTNPDPRTFSFSSKVLFAVSVFMMTQTNASYEVCNGPWSNVNNPQVQTHITFQDSFQEWMISGLLIESSEEFAFSCGTVRRLMFLCNKSRGEVSEHDRSSRRQDTQRSLSADSHTSTCHCAFEFQNEY